MILGRRGQLVWVGAFLFMDYNQMAGNYEKTKPIIRGQLGCDEGRERRLRG